MSSKNFLFITLIGIILFIPFLGHVHLFDWDEVNFAESAREMLETHVYSRVQVNFHPFWEKPPLFIWLQTLSMYVFGVNEFAARLPNAIVGICTLLTVFYVGCKMLDHRFGWLWVACYIGSFLPHFYFKSGIIDPLFNLFIFIGIYQFSRLSNMRNYTESKKLQISALAGLFIGLGILTKGPVAMLVTLVVLFFYWGSMRFRPFLKLKQLLLFLVIAGLVSCAWFGLETIRHGFWFIRTFIEYQIRLLTTEDAGHGGPFYYHFLVLLFGCFPASFFIFNSFRSEVSEAYEVRNMKKWMILLLVAVLLIFSIVKTKIVHYSSLAYFPITFLAAYSIFKLLYMPKARVNNWRYAPMLVTGLLIGVLFAALPFIASHMQLVTPFIPDEFGKATLKADVSWSLWEMLIGIFYFIAILVCFFLLRQPQSRFIGYFSLFICTAVCIQLGMFFFVPQVEGYSQRAAINFFQEKSKEDCYADVLGYKSYAHLFYGQRHLPADTNMLNRDTLLRGRVDKNVYFVTKIQHAPDILKGNPQLEKIGENSGFVFLERKLVSVSKKESPPQKKQGSL
jgi:4-amino-4-deoxy-L-arabinose transferase-like glycosyltransferase